MNWTFWTRTPPIEPDDCETIDPLLSLYADGMTSLDESARVEAHLPGCASCRESLAWMRATRFALASRPVALPPADLRVRIAEAIAASSAAPVPATFTTRRAFALRPALAAAASFVMLGVVGYGLLNHPPPAAVQPVTPPRLASTPRVTTAAPVVKTAPGVKMHLTPHPSAQSKHTRLDPDRIASTRPTEAAPAPAVVKTHAPPKPGPRMLAGIAPIMAPEKVRPAADRKPAPHRLRPELMATNKGLSPAAETRKVLVVKPEPKHTDTAVAEAPHPQTLSAPAIIEKQPIITHDPAPVVAVASSNESRVQTAEEHVVIRLNHAAAQVMGHMSLARDNGGATAIRTMIEQDRTPGPDMTRGSFGSPR